MNTIALGKMPWLYVFSQIFRFYHNAHVINIVPGVVSVTVILKPDFDRWY